MKHLQIILFFFQSISIFSQTEMQNDKYNYDKNCGDGNQQDVNICFNNAILKFTKVVEKKYNCIITYLDSQIKYYSIKDSDTKNQYVKMKADLISSQATWEKLKD